MSNDDLGATNPIALQLYSIRSALLIELAQEHGAALTDLIAGTSLTVAQVRNEEIVTSFHDQVMLINNVMRLFPESGISLEWGRRVNINARERLGLALMSMGTVADVLDGVVRYQQLLRLPCVCHYEIRGENVELILQYRQQDDDDASPLLRFHTESVFVSFYQTMCSLLQRQAPLIEIHMKFSRPVYAMLYERYFPAPIHFSSDRYAIVYPVGILAMRLPTANPSLARRYRNEVDEVLRLNMTTLPTIERVKNILELRTGTPPSLQEVACALHMGERTLRRHLQQQGTTFSQLLSISRITHARRLLENTCQPVHLIAESLGFSDSSSFRKSFRKIVGENPGDYRLRFRETEHESVVACEEEIAS